MGGSFRGFCHGYLGMTYGYMNIDIYIYTCTYMGPFGLVFRPVRKGGQAHAAAFPL